MSNDACKLSFAGESNKWNTAQDAAAVVTAIESHSNLQVLDLENNTLGPEAAKVIGDALARHPEFKRAYFKDLFTGRLKTEIPVALKHLFSGINRSGAKLLELDLSDNALGPVGVEGMVDFMCSPSCYSLEELRLNNNGLGITGGTMLARSLEKLLVNSEKAGQPWKLKVFIAGRNRLEKVGAKIYAPIFEQLGSLEEVAMPQNGIFHEGIAALAKAFSNNPKLRILNLNDNTFTVKGAVAMAKHLPAMQSLEVINFGDCLLKTKGTIAIARSLLQAHNNLKELHLDGNEMSAEGGLSVAEAVQNKKHLSVLNLDCNQFGDEGRAAIELLLAGCGCSHALVPLENNEDPESEEEEDGPDTEEDSECSDSDTIALSTACLSITNTKDETAADGDELDGDMVIIGGTTTMSRNKIPVVTTVADEPLISGPITPVSCTAEVFVRQPTAGHLMGLPITADLPAAVSSLSPTQRINALTALLMATAALGHTSCEQLLAAAQSHCLSVGRALFTAAQEERLVSYVTNTILAHLGLIKTEDKSVIPRGKLQGMLRCLHFIAQQNVVPEQACHTLHYFINSENPRLDCYPEEKNDLLVALGDQ